MLIHSGFSSFYVVFAPVVLLQLDVAMTRASRPGAPFDASLLPPAVQAALGPGQGARSRHAMMREGELALAQIEKNIHAHKSSLRKLHAQVNGR